MYTHRSYTLLLISVLSICLFSGCVGYGSRVSFSSIRMDKPEVSKQQFNYRVFQAVGQRSQVDLANGDDTEESNYDSGTIELDPQVKRNPLTSAFIGAGVIVIPKTEVSVRVGGNYYKVNLKYQFLGDPTEQAKTGNISQALSIGGSKKAIHMIWPGF